MKKENLLSRAEMKKVMGGNEEVIGEIGCTPPGGMCNSHDECCKSIQQTVICMIRPTQGGFAFCEIWR